MSQSSEFQAQDFQVYTDQHEEDPYFSVKRYLQNPKELMEKVLFNCFKILPFFPTQFQSLPEMMKPDTASKDSNNMNLIQQSAFRHEKLKKDILGLLTNGHNKNTIKRTIPSMSQLYEGRQPVYEKYQPNQKSKHVATFLIDSKAILGQQAKKPASYVFPQSLQNTQSINSHRGKVQFSSNFQCGNLFRVYQISYNEYDLVLQNDINTKGNNQWFFFMVKNVPKGLTVKFNIVNLTKKHSAFDFGMKPCVFSMIRFQRRQIGWVRQGLKVNYEENQSFCKQVSGRPYYKLSFEYKFSLEGDIVYFSHSVPYRASDLNSFLFSHIKNPKNSRLVKFRDLNRTLGNQDLDVMEITDFQYHKDNKKVVWIIARQHSGEITSSFMMEGIINFLLSHKTKSNELLKSFIFKIVPMVNVDGVIHGNSRAELSGIDPNRQWANPHKLRNPIIWALKKYIEKDKDKIEMFLDLHSHSRKLGTFFYGNSFRQDKLSTRKYPWMVCKKDQRFSYSDSRFSQYNNFSARHVLFQLLRIPLIYTVESSFYGYQKNDHRIIQYLPNDYRQMGETLLQTLWQYSQCSTSIERSILETPISKINYLSNEQKLIQEISKEQLDNEDKQSIGSDSDPGEDEFTEKEKKKILPNLYGVKKEKKLKSLAKKNKQKQGQGKKASKQQNELTSKLVKKNEKQSHYRIYFSGRNSYLDKRYNREKGNVEMKDYGAQTSVPDSSVLKGFTNISASLIQDRKASLCIWGQKMEEQFTVFGNNVGVQADMQKVFQNREQRKSLPSRKNFKLSSRVTSILQVKENNFLNRGDCHQTTPLVNLTRR